MLYPWVAYEYANPLAHRMSSRFMGKPESTVNQLKCHKKCNDLIYMKLYNQNL